MLDLKRHLPNFFTCLNLSCGFLALVMVFYKDSEFLVLASYLIGLAAFFDFLDGFSARLLNQYSDFGKELDSLADMVTFGVVPGAIMFHLIMGAIPETNGLEIALVAVVIPICSALRLAKFNIAPGNPDYFVGMPTPANALFIGSLPLVIEYDQYGLAPYLGNDILLLIITLVFSLLLVSPIKMFSLKFKNLRWASNQLRYIFLLLSIGFVVAFHVTAIPFIVILYTLLSFLQVIIGRNSKT